MIGIHGAGLNMYAFLPFGSTVIEVHPNLSTHAQKNSANFVNHIGGGPPYNYTNGKYVSVKAYKDEKNAKIPVEPIWEALSNAVEDWMQRNHHQRHQNGTTAAALSKMSYAK